MTTTTSDTKRLHITPFSPDILPSVLPASIRSLATEISFHSIPTFPENDFGYVTLPTMEADKIKKKLNGSILKGKKFKVDTARPKKRSRTEEEDAGHAAHKSSSDKKSKKQKAGEEVLEGVELPSDRKVKRGWTESADAKQERRKDEKRNKKGKDEKAAKSQAKSKYTEKSECLFRTKVPPNKASTVDEKSEKQTKKKNKSSQETVVHEFSKTVTQPSFLRSENNGSTPTSGFEQGKGWVDEAGNVKENVSDRIRTDQYRPGQKAGAKEKGKSKSQKTIKEPEPADESEDWTSSSGESSSEEDSTDSESDGDDSSSSTEETDDSSSSSDDDQSVHPEQDKTKNDNTPSEGVHPLEALFKRPAPGSSEVKPDTEENAPFSFFGQDDIESEEEVEEKPAGPHTPFTKRDLQNRGLRSAAPTPDTALVGRGINWNGLGPADPMDLDGAMHLTTPIPKAAAKETDDSEFVKWFWENRGDNNRAWKRRRREAAKEHRQRDNRSKGMKGKS
ncbi:hypothetical protein BO70DRAFT_365195 [Aspergillus heteromorphus CBS 117.55]|uniref:Suppressor protein SRP40 n=1 Tax=Aspergillus heteromorphus CBS 117.55 TaxID=1448321 RepID=A0A317VES9_9EURO|nr:uncharacterized protein BO70DRAFT_365195 [Aspergillus heteromorphus CBS 117.55]PWY71468.1 hypothetical protein BO70DRAFT_365195 [Aspergillus heteromorphus CBS 117.55]